MSPRSSRRSSRRETLQTAITLASVGAMGSLGGCLDRLGFGDDEDPGRLAVVPDGVSFAGHADVEAILADDGLREGIDAELSGSDGELAGNVDDSEAVLDAVEDETGLDPRGVSELLVFGDDSGDGATIVWTDWSEAELREVLESETSEEIETGSYGGRTTYAVSDLLVGVLEEGVYTFGVPTAVRSVVDVEEGGGTAVEGDLREAYLAAREGHVRYGFVPGDAVVDRVPPIYDRLVEGVRHGWGAVYADGGERVIEIHLRTTDVDTAEDVQNVLEGGVALQQEIEEAVGGGPIGETLREAVDGVEVVRDEDVVTVEYRDDVAEIAPMLVVLAREILRESSVSLAD